MGRSMAENSSCKYERRADARKVVFLSFDRGAFQCSRYIGCADAGIALEFVGVTVTLFELEYGAECIIIPRIKSGRTQFHIFNKRNIEHALWSAGAALCLKVVQHRDLDPIYLNNRRFHWVRHRG